MKSIIRSITLVGLLFLSTSLSFAQQPKIAIRYGIDNNCVKGSLVNITTATINVRYVELWIYDQKTCKRVCVKRKVIEKRIARCDSLAFDLCCDDLPKADRYIDYVRVNHSGGTNEQWNVM